MLRLAFVLCVLLVACACVCVPVFALSVRGHVPDGSFGALGSGDGQFSGSVAVAVNEAGGDVYVLDRVNSRVERFDSEGKFV
ncbi:MAG TPA: hypothetical protein VES65_04925, partial [Solirubrobacteraceae bacterium]|nr:hypothetical protein [Solirubrobacteraceae bacterium]